MNKTSNKAFRRPSLDTSALALPKPRHSASLKEQDPEVPKGMERKRNTRGTHERLICVTDEAKALQREMLYLRANGRCEGCGIDIYLDVEPDSPLGFDGDHVDGRGFGGGKRCDCLRVENGKPTCIQALCRDRILENNEVRYGCHTMKHRSIDRKGKFTREARSGA